VKNKNKKTTSRFNKTKQKQQDPETKLQPFLVGNKTESQKVEKRLKGAKCIVKKWRNKNKHKPSSEPTMSFEFEAMC